MGTSLARPRSTLQLTLAVIACILALAVLALAAARIVSRGADRAGEPAGMGSMMGPGMMREMHVIHGLLADHARIERTVEDIPGGVRTVTTSADPEVAAQIRAHVHQMKARLERGRPIRRMDPVFREIFRHHDEIRLSIEDIPGGVRVIETSDNPQVVLLIRQHARRAVSEFVERGMDRAMEPTPLPPGYDAGE